MKNNRLSNLWRQLRKTTMESDRVNNWLRKTTKESDKLQNLLRKAIVENDRVRGYPK